MKQLLRLLWSLAIIGAASGGILAYTDNITRDGIARAARQELRSSLGRALPEYDNEPDIDTLQVAEAGRDWTFYIARKGGQYAGTACVSASGKGYGGEIKVVLGIAADNTIQGIDVLLPHSETPGLGAKITEDKFKAQFKGRAIDSASFKVKKDGGDIDAITGATISSRAVAEAVRNGADAYRRHAGEIAGETGK